MEHDEDEPAYVSPTIRTLREQASQFAQQYVVPRVPTLETGETDRYLIGLIAERGWLGLTIPAEYGGGREDYGGGHLAKTIMLEELAYRSAAVATAVQASILGTAKILHFGNSEQKRRWLPAVAQGQSLPTIAVTDPAVGGYVLGMGGRAERRGGGWVINASKAFIGNSHIGTLHGVVVPTPGKQARKARSRALSAFLVEADQPGVSLGDWYPSLGLRGFSFGMIDLKECRVPDEALLGQVGDGMAVAYSSSVLYGRLNLAAVAFGLQRAIVDEAVAFSLGREIDGQPLTRLGTIKDSLGEMASRLRTSRTVLYDAAHRLDQGLPCDADLLNANLTTTELAVASADSAMRILAAHALLAGHPVGRYLTDAYCLLPPAGTSHIQRARLADMLTGADKHKQWSTRFANPVPAGELAGVS